jgi:hypothetical protein
MIPSLNQKNKGNNSCNTVFYKHQYIANPKVLPKLHIVVAAQQLATALQGYIPTGKKTTEA